MSKRTLFAFAALTVVSCAMPGTRPCRAQNGERSPEPGSRDQVVAASMARLKGADPVAEANRLADTGRFEFRGVYGQAMVTPGIGRQSYAGPLRSVKISVIPGTGEGVLSGEQEKLNDVAEAFARKFNRQMLARMRSSKPPHPAAAKLDRVLAQELRLLEKGDPRADFQRDLKSKHVGFIESVGSDRELQWQKTSGAERDPLFERIYYGGVGSADGRLLTSTSDLVPHAEFARFVRAYKRYAVPYNRLVFAHLKQVSASAKPG